MCPISTYPPRQEKKFKINAHLKNKADRKKLISYFDSDKFNYR